MILVTGASGQVGSQVVRALIERGADVRVFVRDPERLRGLYGDGVDVAVGDFADRPSVRAALQGVEQLFLSCGDDPRRVEWETSAIDTARAAGVRRIVKLSSPLAEPGSPVAFWDWHGQVEQHLWASGVPAVVLRSGFYMTNLLAAAGSVAAEGRIYAPGGAARIGMIDPRDVGEAAAAVLLQDGHVGRMYLLTGPEAVTYEDVAAQLGAALGRRVGFVDLPDEPARQAMIHQGVPAFVADQIVTIHALARQGALDAVNGTVQALTGRPPRDVETFGRDHAYLFTPVAQVAGAAR